MGRLRILALVGCFSMLVACGGGSITPPPPPTPDFGIAVSPAAISLAPGGSSQIQITRAALNGFSGSISVTAASVPAGVTFSPALPQQLGPGGLTLAVAADPAVVLGNYTPLFLGTAAGLQHSADVQISVQNRADLVLTAPTNTVQITQAATASFDVTIDGTGGVLDFNVQLQAVTANGIAATFSNTVVSPNTTVTLTLTASPTAIVGPDAVLIEATRSVDGVEFSTNVPIAVAPVATIAGTIQEFVLPTPNAAPSAIAKGPDFAMWFGEESANQLGRTGVDGTITECPIPTPNAGIGGVATGVDGNIYFSEFKTRKIGSYNPSLGQFTEWATPLPAAGPGGIITAPDGSMWIMGAAIDTLFHVTAQGAFLSSVSLTPGCYPHGPVVGSDGSVWFACITANKIASVTPQGTVTYFNLPNPSSLPTILASGSDGNIYFTEQVGRIGQLNLSTLTFTEWIVPAANSVPYGIGSIANNICFTERAASKIARMPAGGGTMVEYATPTPSAIPAKIVPGPDGRLWFTEQGADKIAQLN